MKNLQELLEDLEYETRSYEGRGMNGRSCLAITVSSGFNVGKLFADILGTCIERLDERSAEDPDRYDDEWNTVIEAFENMQTDSMGKGVVIYFPTEKYEEE